MKGKICDMLLQVTGTTLANANAEIYLLPLVRNMSHIRSMSYISSIGIGVRLGFYVSI